MSMRLLLKSVGSGLLLAVMIFGCEATTHHGIAIMPDESASAMALTGRAESNIPVEFLVKGDACATSASISPGDDMYTLAGVVEGKSFSALGPSNVVRIEAISEDGQIVWSDTTRIIRSPMASSQQSKLGTYRVQMPSDITFDHFHIGVVDKTKSDMMLKVDCEAMKE